MTDIDPVPAADKALVDQTFSHGCPTCRSRNWSYGYWRLFGYRLLWTIYIYDFCTECGTEFDIPQARNRFTKWLMKRGHLITP